MPSPPSPRPSPRKRRLVRVAVWFVPLCLAVILAMPWLARRVIGPERLKALAADTLSQSLGRQVTVLGDVSITPWLALSISRLRVADDPAFGPGPLLEAARTTVSIRLLPLFARVVSPGAVRVQGLLLHLRRDASGRANWDDLIGSLGQATSAPSGWQVLPQPRDIRITQAAIDYYDARTGETWTVTDGRLSTGLGQPFKFTVFFRSRGMVGAGELECHAQGGASLDPDTGRLSLRQVQLNAGLTFPEAVVAGGASPVSVSGRADLNYDPGTDSLEVSGLEARVPGAILRGSARVVDPVGAFRAETDLTLTADLAGGWRDILGLTPGEPPGSLQGQGSPEPAREPAEVPEARLTGEKPAEPGQAVATITARADAASLTVSALHVRLPQGSATASGTLDWRDVPALDLSLAAEDVDFGGLPLPAGRDSWVLPMAWLSMLRLDARLDLRRCRLGRLALADFHATAKGRDGQARLYPVSAVLPAGLASLDARIDATREALALDVRAALDPVGTAAPAAPGTPVTTRLRLTGRVEPAGAQGTFNLQSPDMEAAGRMLGLSAGDLPATSLACRGGFAASPGANRPIKRLALTDLEANLAGTTLRGQLAFSGGAAAPVTFDLATDTLDFGRLTGLAGTGGSGGGVRAEGKLRADRLVVRGLEAKNAAAMLREADGRIEAELTGADLLGGRLAGKIENDPSGRITANLHLTGAEASKLPGNLGLSGALTAKASLETALPKPGRSRTFKATLEAEAPQLGQGSGADRLVLANPKLVASLTARDAPAGSDDLPLDASVTVTCPGTPHLRDIRLTAQGPLVLDKTGRLREGGPAKVDAGALWRGGFDGHRDLHLSLAGPLSLDTAGGGFSAGDLRLDAGGLVAVAKVWRKGGENTPVGFSVDTGVRPPRQVLSGWGLTLPRNLAADRLTKGSLALSGTAGANGCDIARLVLTLDDSTLTGRGNLPKYDPKRAKWELSLDRLDCDAYFPPGSGATSEDRHKPLDLKWLRELSLDARLKVGWFKKGNVTFDMSTMTLNARDGNYTYRQESPRFYGGRFFSEVRGDVREGVLRSAVELKLEGFECARFLKEWAEGETLASGGATFILAARTSGASEAELRGNLAGNARLQITRGELKVKDSGSQKQGEAQSGERIPFDVFSSSWVSREGVAHTDDFFIDSPRMQVHGKGFVDLRNETINLSVLAALPGDREAPATIIGPLENPKLTVDRGKLVGDFMYRLIQGIVSIPGKALTHILLIR